MLQNRLHGYSKHHNGKEAQEEPSCSIQHDDQRNASFPSLDTLCRPLCLLPENEAWSLWSVWTNEAAQWRVCAGHRDQHCTGLSCDLDSGKPSQLCELKIHLSPISAASLVITGLDSILRCSGQPSLFPGSLVFLRKLQPRNHRHQLLCWRLSYVAMHLKRKECEKSLFKLSQPDLCCTPTPRWSKSRVLWNQNSRKASL